MLTCFDVASIVTNYGREEEEEEEEQEDDG